MRFKDYIREREQRILEIIGTGEKSARDIAMALETDTGKAGSYLYAMQRKEMLVVNERTETIDCKVRTRLYWRAKN